MKITLSYQKKKIALHVKKLKGMERYRGLMFRKKENVLFEFKKDVNLAFHSLFVFFPFLMIWLDKKNKVLEYRRVNPFTWCVLPERSFRKVVEIPLSPSARRFLAFFDGKGKV